MDGRLPVPFPVRGVSERLGTSDRERLYAQDAQNCRARVPSGRLQGGQRPGTSRHSPSPVAIGTPVRNITIVSYPVPNQTYTSLGNSLTTEWDEANTVTGDSLAVVAGAASDMYVTDGGTGIAKLNGDGVKQWKIALAADDSAHVVRALAVDAGTPDERGSDLVIAGTSTGGSSLRGRVWAYVQKDDNKNEKLWELKPGAYCEAIKVHADKLYLALNYPDKNRAEVVVFDSYLTPDPVEVRRWQVPYPVHDFDVSPKDGTIFTASNANARRDVNPDAPKGSFASEDWTIFDLANYKERVRCWFDAGDRDTLAITPRNLAFENYPLPGVGGVGDDTSDTIGVPTDTDDGGNVTGWLDKSGQGRNLFQTGDEIPLASGSSATQVASRGAIFRKRGINGQPCLHFDGVTTGMRSEKPPSTSFERSERGADLSVLPSHKGAQFVVVMTCRVGVDSGRRGLLGWGNTSARRYIYTNWEQSSAAPRPGQVRLEETGGTATTGDGTSSPDSNGVDGPNTRPLGHGIPDSGFVVLTWVCDGHLDDAVGTSSRSVFRVNGIPCDRWRSAAYTPTGATTLGYVRNADSGVGGFVGEVKDIIILHDWYDSNDVHQRLIEMPGYPDANFATGGDTELERIEGWLAHRAGIAHELPGGRAAHLAFKVNPNNNDEAVVDAITYRFRSAGLAQAYDVLIGADTGETALNFSRAVNRTGSPGEESHRATVANPTHRASGPFMAPIAGTNHYTVMVRSRSSFAAAATTTESTGAARLEWSHATTQATINGAGANKGWYPHPFYIDRTTNTAGGPPRTAGASVISNYWRLRSPYPILAAWDPANGKARAVLTSGYDGVGSGVGGVGYGVRVSSLGHVFSCGPRQAAVLANSAWSASAILADPIDVRKIGWAAQAFVVSGGTTDPWFSGSASTTVSAGPLGYAYPRMAVDQWDNLWVPWFNTTGGNEVSLVGYRNASASGNSVEFCRYVDLPDNQEAHAVAVDPRSPKYPAAGLTQPEFVVLATRVEAVPTTRDTLYKLKTILATLTSGSPRAIKALAVADSNLVAFTTSGNTTVAAGGLDTTRGWVDSAVLVADGVTKAYFVDGKQAKVYDPVAGTLTVFRSTSTGLVPPRCSLVGSWRGSLWMLRSADNPAAWWKSKTGDPANWETKPYTINALQAVQGDDSRPGLPSDVINGFAPTTDDVAYLFGDHSILRFVGDPTPEGGGKIELVSDTIGGAFGRAWCKDSSGALWFMSTKGSIYRIRGGALELMSRAIDTRIQAIDFGDYYARLEWNDRDRGIHVILCPFGAGGTIMEHWFYEVDSEAWWPDKWFTSLIQPTAIATLDGDDPEDRTVLLGCEDGYIRAVDVAALGDDVVASTGLATYPVDSFVRIGPLAPKESEWEYLFSRLEAVMKTGEGAPWAKVYVTRTSDLLGDPVWQGKLVPGRSPWKNFRRRGAFVFVELRLMDQRQRWSYEQISLSYEQAGMKR